MGAGLGAGREGVWQALGVRGRAGERCRQLGSRAQGVAGTGRSGREAQRARGRAEQTGRAEGRARERQARRAAGALAAGAQGARQGRCWARCSRGTGAVRAAMHGLGVAWALDGCAGWASWASFGAQCTWLSYDSVFGPGSTRYFLESPNEHCSL